VIRNTEAASSPAVISDYTPKYCDTSMVRMIEFLRRDCALPLLNS
jgi:hypothetical protein